MFSVKRCVNNPSHYLFVGPEQNIYQFDLVTQDTKESESIEFDIFVKALLAPNNICLWSFLCKESNYYTCSKIVEIINPSNSDTIVRLKKNGRFYKWSKQTEITIPEEIKSFMLLNGFTLKV